VPRKKKIDELVVITLLNQAKDRIDDPIAVNRVLREVGKFLDVLTGGAMMDGTSRRRIVSHIERGEKGQALAAIEQYLEAFQRRIEPEGTPQPPSDAHSPSCAT
jgi:hypothetical protein